MNTDQPLGPQVPIRTYRESLSLSIDQLCERIEPFYGKKPHDDTIRNVELGHKRASIQLMNAWARALGLSPVDVYQPPSRSDLAEQVSA